MIAVIFEVEPADGKMDTYLETAGELREALENIDGFISIERFESLVQPGKLLSLSFWRDGSSRREIAKTPCNGRSFCLGSCFAGIACNVYSNLRCRFTISCGVGVGIVV